ncbi:hypothetical protein [Streptomyces sp. NPDC059651]|uniref:hypothetical protein n=1 Tax=Streptomyces sp. NPDC059651 TaxID=3346897 RepID=UPI0036AA5361
MTTELQERFYRRIDAVLRSEDDGHIAWFFRDRLDVRYDLKADQGVAGPKEIAGNWPGVPHSFTLGVDAALNRRDRPTVGYLFEDDQYVRYDLAATEPTRLPQAHPRQLAFLRLRPTARAAPEALRRWCRPRQALPAEHAGV